MKTRNKISLLAISLMLVSAVGCGPTEKTDNVVTTSEDPTPLPPAPLPDGNIKIKASAKEVEVNSTITIRAIIDIDSDDQEVVFSVDKPDLVKIEAVEGAAKINVTGVKPGSCRVKVCAHANSEVEDEVKITVVEEKPTLSKAIENIIKADNYTIVSGDYVEESGKLYENSRTVVTRDAIVSVDYNNKAIVKDENGNERYGEVIPQGKENAVYITKDGSKFVTEDAEVVRSNVGLVTKDELRGRGNNALCATEVGDFYGIDAINPSWVDEFEKTDDNTYEIEGKIDTNTMMSIDHEKAFVETLLWQLADRKSFSEATAGDSGEIFPASVASSVSTTIKVTGQAQILAIVQYAKKQYAIQVQDVNESTLPEVPGLQEAISVITGKELALPQDLQDGIKAVQTNNYVQKNLLYPDHETEFTYFTYYTEDYVFFDCNKAFRDGYNTVSEEEWTQVPYGYKKTATGLERFEYDEALNTVTVETVPDTDASTSLYQYAGYFSTLDCLTSDLIWSFEDKADKIWNAESTVYHKSDSLEVMNQIIGLYAPEDMPDYVDRCMSGIGVEYKNDKVDVVNVTSGYCPFLKSASASDRTFGVDRFSLTDFGQATNNSVDSLL